MSAAVPGRARLRVAALYAALDAERQTRSLSWRQTAKECGLSPSTMTRLANGLRPDVDAFATLVRWLDQPADDFITLEHLVVQRSDHPTHRTTTTGALMSSGSSNAHVNGAEYDEAVYSNVSRRVEREDGTIAWERETWREMVEELRLEVQALAPFRRMVADLDRNEHGRHEGDVDAGDPTGVSHGNPRLQTGDVLGYDIGGRSYVMPERGRRGDPIAWRTE